ncbi:MAG TPA: MFS transporter [Puia sp.]|nr:MFS transporter [Puia sp.]
MTPSFLKVRLRLMMFLQFFIWGAWYATVGNYMRHSGMTSLIYLAYLASPIGSILSPFFLGMIADRFFSVQKVMGVMHVLAGIMIFAAPYFAEGPWQSPAIFLLLLLLHMLCYMPTVGLATATAFHLLEDKERSFPSIRVFGSGGWIVAGFLVSYVWKADSTALPLRVAGLAAVLMGLYSFTLPNVPPPGAGKRSSFRDITGLTALSRLRSKPFLVFIVSLLLTSIPLATYYAYVPLFLRMAGMATPAFKMTFGQMSEICFLLLLPWFFIRLGIKWVFIVGMSAWMLRYALFALAATHPMTWMMILGIVLHGVCYDFVYIAGQIYIDRKASVDIRAQAQGLFVMVSYGIGQGLGTLFAGWIFNRIMSSGAGQSLAQWQFFWFVPLLFATLITFLFAFGFREKAK